MAAHPKSDREARPQFAPQGDQHDAEIEAASTEQQLRLALEAGRMGTWQYNIATGDVKWSPELEALHSLEPGSFPGSFEAFERSIHPEDRDRVVKAIARAVDRRVDHRIEYRIQLSDGTLRWLEARGRVFCDRNGRPTCTLGVCADITERKKDDEDEDRARLVTREQAARDEFERASRLNEQFLAMLSHDLRTPLNAIVIWANLLASGSLSPEKTRRAVDSIVRNARAQADLVQSLLDLSRVVAGTLQLNMQDVDLVAAVRAATQTLRPEIERRGLTVEMALPTSPVTVAGDPERLQQVFWNVLTHAISSTPDAGRVEIRVTSIDSSVHVQVSDSGRRAAEGPNRSEPSNGGIGPAIVRELVHAHGGTITADGAGDGQGHTFVVTLPVRSGARLSREAAPDGRAAARSG